MKKVMDPNIIDYYINQLCNTIDNHIVHRYRIEFGKPDCCSSSKQFQNITLKYLLGLAILAC